ncbi:MAG: RdgB/HAM1 family non-canonical purine NTP pyrophosphatase [Beijerinckiaceae bacterium]|nr:RdgB/HAM1 family non-canonical purine NTP pyrophosphatase [Beijerinckiaceae bacterium]
MAQHRLLTGKVVLATHNKGKLVEMRELMAPYGIELVSAGELGLPEPEEDGYMFSENAAIKAVAACKASGLPALSDDSGLCVDALDGAPGLFSANWAGPGKDFGPAMARVLAELAKRGATTPEQRRAHFTSALVIAWPDGHQELFEGRVFGTIVDAPRGTGGFGYNPIFQPDGYPETFAEMTTTVKSGADEALSHRARAFAQLAAACLRKPA